MSLKTRLRLSIVALVVSIVLALSALNLHSVATARSEDVLERARMSALQVQSVLVQRLNEQTVKRTPPANLDETKALWSEIVRSDQELTSLLKDTMASSRTTVEIAISGEDGRILTSSNPATVGTPARKLPSLENWTRKSPWEKLWDIFTQRLDYEVRLPLGVAEQQAPVFEIQVAVSSVLLRNTLVPQMWYFALALLVSFLGALALAMLVSNLAFRPLAKISDAIDRIARGESVRDDAPGEGESKEYTALQSKLSVLGQQFRGAREDAVQLRGNIERLLERLEEVVLLFDRNDRLIVAGRSAENFLGRGRWEMFGRGLDEVFPSSTPLGAVIQSAVQLRHPVKDHLVQLDRSGQAAARLLVNVELLEDFPSHERLGTMVSLRDAESRRQLQSQLDVSTRLEAISRLTGGVAHEIKNPLNAIALHLEVLKSRLGSDAELEQEIGIISSEITRLDRVVKTFLDFTRPVDLRLATVDLGKLVGEVATLVEPQARTCAVEVVADTGHEPARIRGDRDLLKQAVLNVVMNGVEAMKNGGRLEIQVRRSGEDCTVRVSDQGPGIPPETRGKIFNLYFTTKGKGSGIGLAMTFRIVQLHNGTIDCTSETGKGTTFWLRFSAAGEEETAGKEPAAAVEES
ncbi:MAG TPA: ATP-binding protein [Bryobacteraceae bacterium]|nr:ATP-binding protein [Bryobacteraceae bacterium]